MLRKVTGRSNFSNISLRFKKMGNYLRQVQQVFQKYIFFVRYNIKTSIISLREVLLKCWELSLMNFILQFICIVFLYPQSPQANPFRGYVICAPLPQQNNFQNFSLFSKHINNSLSCVSQFVSSSLLNDSQGNQTNSTMKG